jgi:hypothetical protein
MNRKMKDIIFEFKYLIVILLLGLLITPILYLITKFNKKITVKDKYIRYRKKSSNYHIVDSEDNIYLVDNLWFIADFNRAEDYNKLEKGKSYNVSGYSLRVPVLDMYPKIYSIN